MVRGSAAAPLAIPAFRTLWSSNLLANFGVMAQAVTATWLMAHATDGDPAWVASVQTASALPLVLLSLPAGALADMFDRRVVMLCAQTLTLLSATALLLTALFSDPGPMTLLLFSFTGGAGFALANPAWHTSIRLQIADDRLLEPAILLNAVGYNLARSIGPAIGGGIIALAGPSATLGVSTALVLPLVIALARWRPAPHTTPSDERLGSAIAAGLRYVRWRPSLAALTMRACLFTFCGASIWALAPVVAHDRLGGQPGTLGLLIALFGGGAFAGAMTRARFAHWRRARLLAACTLLYALAIVGLALADGFIPAGLAMALAGATWVAGLTGLNVAIQVHAARWVSARAISLLQVALFLGLSAGSFCWGMIADRHGLTAALLCSAAAMTATLLLGRQLPIVSDDAVDLTPVPALAYETGDHFPLIVERRYQPLPGSEQRLHSLLQDLGRARRRDGAARWTLRKDASGAWLERFEMRDEPAEHRRRARRTREDENLEFAIDALTTGEYHEP